MKPKKKIKRNKYFIGQERYCRPLPGTIVSERNSLSIEFITDSTTEYKGFEIEYGIGCGGTLTNPGKFASPDYPNAYPKPRECDYIIQAPDTKVINLRFEAFALDDSDDEYCENHFLAVYDGKTNRTEEMFYGCDNRMPEPIRSTGPNLLVQFVTDGSSTDHGFLASFDFEEVGCGGTYKGLF